MASKQELRAKVLIFEERIDAWQKAIDIYVAKREELTKGIRDLHPKLGFREKYLRGFFGGNRKLLVEYERCLGELESCSRSINAFTETRRKIEEELDRVIERHLLGEDRSFAKLLVRYRAAYEVKCAADQFMRTIDDAFALAKKDVLCGKFGIDTQAALRSVKNAAPHFRYQVLDYNDYRTANLEGVTIEFNDDEVMDIALDATLEGFNFKKLSNASSPQEAKSLLETLRGRMLRNKKKIDDTCKELDSLIRKEIKTTRDAHA